MIVTLDMAMSVNGIVARPDGSEDFLSDSHWAAFGKQVREHGCLIVGRRTVEAVAKYGPAMGFHEFPDARKVVVSGNDAWEVPEGFVRVRSPSDALALLTREGHTRALLAGGPTVNRAFLQEGLVDFVAFRLEPTLVGAGMSVIASGSYEFRLALDGEPRAEDGIVMLRYRVVR